MNRRQARIRAYELAGVVLPTALARSGLCQSIDAEENRKVEDALCEIAAHLEQRAARMRAMDGQMNRKMEQSA